MKTYIVAAAAATALLAAPVWAQDVEDEEEDTTEEEAAVAEDASGEEYETVSDSDEYNDSGEEAQVQLQDEQPKTDAKKFVSAKKILQNMLDEVELEEGFDEENEQYISIGTAEITVEDPSTTNPKEDFFVIRDHKVLQATLMAKAEIIRNIQTEFSAYTRANVSVPGDNEEEEAKMAWKEAQAALEASRDKLVDRIAVFDKKEADAFAGVNVGDRFAALLDGVIKKVDSSYDTEALAASKKKECEEMKAELARMKAESERLAAEAEKLFPKEPVQETGMEVRMLATMPLIGAVPVTTAESWNPKTKIYQVAVAVIWSPRLHDRATKILHGNPIRSDVCGDKPIKKWIKEDIDLSKALGSRQYIDDQGNVYFVGFSARGMDCPASLMAGKRRQADVSATTHALLALFSDTEAYTEAKSYLKQYNIDGVDSNKTMEKLTEKVSAKVEKMSISGNGRVASDDEATEFISGRDAYVTAYAFNASAAVKAAAILKKSFEDAVGARIASQTRAGALRGMREALTAVENDKTVENAAAAAAKKETIKGGVDSAIRNAPKNKGGKPGVVIESDGGAGAGEGGKRDPKGGGVAPEKKINKKLF